MAKLSIMFKDKVLQEIEINKTISVGREIGDIMIKNPAVSARHMKIEKTGSSYTARDLNSTNGTLVNGKPITSQLLRSGDVITVGKHKIVFENPDEVEETPSFSDEDMGGRTLVMDQSQLQAMMNAKGRGSAGIEFEKEEAGKEEGTAAKTPKLFLSQMSGAPAVIPLEKDSTLIGSSEKADIRIKGITVGKVAASITRNGEDYEMEYKGGMAKLKINGKPIDKHTLANGDRFSIGAYNFEFRTEL